ncbi:Nematode resistance protein-like HSPRO2 [Apostasia shenzhenica]|uniref:Nematode resistance protein-like HSPRO2 n=1 Tax=Apostasia shenzhenica TaxID=1088818 RepID=A0A2I0A8Y1_9ASPA|nr:Nematode resistance protein-like HSPRO2 [Apostasia shenzhenica]
MAAASEISSRSPPPAGTSPAKPAPSSPKSRDASLAAAYERYLRLPELARLWGCRNFPDWKNESVLRPGLHAIEITFRLISVALSDPRPYANHWEWSRRLESLAAAEIGVIAALCEDGGGAPVADLRSSKGVLARNRSSQEVWQLPGGAGAVVSRTSEESLLPRLASWEASQGIAGNICWQIESRMLRSPFTLGLGEPNLSGKPILEYDLVVRPSDLHALKKSPFENLNNNENKKLFTIHQIFEAWLCAARELAKRIGERIDASNWEAAAGDCWLLERIWKLLSEVTDLHLLMDPDDLLRLKGQLAIRASSGSEAFCFRSAALLEVTESSSKDLKRRVPAVLGVEADPNGAPRLQRAAMRLFHGPRRGESDRSGKIHLLQAFQAIEAAVKRFYFGYRQLVTATMGSLEAAGCRPAVISPESGDALSQMFLEPPYFPSLDAAKTFLGELWQNENRQSKSDGRCGARH